MLARRWLPGVFIAAVAFALVSWLYRDIALGRFFAELKGAKPGWLLVLAATIWFEQLANGWKWRQLLYDVKPVGTLRLTNALLAGYGANVLVPLGVSPLVRSWLIARLEALPMGTVLMTTVIARFVDGVVFALFAGLIALASVAPSGGGDIELGLMVAGALNLILFGSSLWALFRYRLRLAESGSLAARLFDRVAAWAKRDGAALRATLADGVVWPRSALRQGLVIAGAVAAKLIASTHYVWAGLAVGVVLAPMDYLFLMVFAGFSLVLTRFIRLPAGFVVGSALAFHLLGVPEEEALAMILFNWVLSILIVVGLGLTHLWRSGLDIRKADPLIPDDPGRGPTRDRAQSVPR